jgi:hypothetical protein
LEGSREIYRVAFQTANAELTEINAEFEKLRARKEQIEKLVAVLLVLFGEKQNAAAASQGSSSEDAQTAATNATESNPEPQPLQSDPFQRRIDHVLGIGAGIRDVRKYTRQF